MSKKVIKESKLSRCLKAPIRFLIKARDFYMKSMTECSERIGYGAFLGCPTGQVNGLPRSYSVSWTKSNNGDEDLRELIRAASTRGLGNKVQLEVRRGQPARLPRSHSTVVIGRIDEDKPCNFEEDEDHIIRVKAHQVFPRSRSCAVTNKTTVLF